MPTAVCTVGEKREAATGEGVPATNPADAGRGRSANLTPGQRATNFQRNLDAMVAVLKRGYKHPDQERTGLELERVLCDETGKRVVYPGPAGVSAMLHMFMELHPDYTPVHIDGHLMGFSYTYDAPATTDGPAESFAVAVSPEPGAQVEVSADPVANLANILAAIDSFDAELERVMRLLGRPAHLVVCGYDTVAVRPEDVELVPKERCLIMDSYLPRQGTCAHDMMCCSTSTQASIDYTDEPGAMTLEKVATVLGPVLCFAIDSSPVWRGEPVPRMVRGRIWDEPDPSRCGIIPGSLDRDFTFERCCTWLGTVKPILMTDHEHRTYAVACASFMISPFYNHGLAAGLPFDPFAQTDEGVEAVRHELESKGWDAAVYGVGMAELLERLAGLARDHARSEFDRRGIDLLLGLWAGHRLPRDVACEELAALRAWRSAAGPACAMAATTCVLWLRPSRRSPDLVTPSLSATAESGGFYVPNLPTNGPNCVKSQPQGPSWEGCARQRVAAHAVWPSHISPTRTCARPSPRPDAVFSLCREAPPHLLQGCIQPLGQGIGAGMDTRSDGAWARRGQGGRKLVLTDFEGHPLGDRLMTRRGFLAATGALASAALFGLASCGGSSAGGASTGVSGSVHDRAPALDGADGHGRPEGLLQG